MLRRGRISTSRSTCKDAARACIAIAQRPMQLTRVAWRHRAGLGGAASASCFEPGSIFTEKRCCSGGTGGDPQCWDGKEYTFAKCCGGSGGAGSAAPNSFELEFRCTCDAAAHGSCGAHGKCRGGVCECTGGYQLLDGLCEDASCVGVDCGGHGTCHGSGSSQTRDDTRGVCECEDGWAGADCTTPDPCSHMDCGAHGQCVPSSNGGRGECACRTGWRKSARGDSCEQDPCAGKQCENGGHCEEGRCICTDFYSGELCTDDCAKSFPGRRVVYPPFELTSDLVVKVPAEMVAAGATISSPQIRATGCDPLSDLCLKADCTPAQPTGVPVCRPGGPEFACEISGELYSDCSCTDACAGVYCGHGGTCDPENGRCVCTSDYGGPECMDDCAAFIPNQRMIHGQFMTGNKEIAATGCNPLRDLCMLEWCAPQDDVPVCRIGGPDFVCSVGGQMRNDCTCVQPLYPCNQMDPEVYPGGIVHNCNVRKPPHPARSPAPGRCCRR